MMKILHIVPTYYPAARYGGPIKSVHELNKWLVKRRAEVVVYTTNLDGKGTLNVQIGKSVDVDGVKVFYFPITFRPWQYSFRLHRALAKNVEDFDLIHITSVFLSASTLGAYYARKCGKPYVISPRGSLMAEPLKKGFLKNLKKKIYISLIEKRNLAGASAIHFTTEMEKKEYLKAGLPLKKAIVIPNGYEIRKEYENTKLRNNFQRRFNISDDKKIVLFLSRLSWKKGLDTLIPAFAEVVKKEPKAVLILAGPDEEGYKKEIEEMLRNTKLYESTKVIFTGMLLDDDKAAAYVASDVFVLPSYAENFGMAVVEAMAAGLPAIIAKGVGISDEVKKADAGIVIEKDEKQLAEAILKILDNPDLAEKMGENGRKLVETEFSAGKVAERWIEEYNNLITNNQ